MRLIKVISVFLIFILLTSHCTRIKYVQGQRLYNQYCADCHMEDGSGVAKLYPKLSPIEEMNSTLDDLPCIILNGLKTEHSTVEMLGIKDITDVEINNIINYILIDLNNKKDPLLIHQTQASIKNCH